MATFTTSKGDRLLVCDDGYLGIKTHNGNSFSGYLKDGKVTETTPLGRRILEKAYLEYLQNHEPLNTQHQ
jgi:hypothetical protein